MNDETKLIVEKTIEEFKKTVSDNLTKDLKEREINQDEINKEIEKFRDTFVSSVFVKIKDVLKDFDEDKIKQIINDYFDKTDFEFKKESEETEETEEDTEEQPKEIENKEETEETEEDTEEQPKEEKETEESGKEIFKAIQTLKDNFEKHLESSQNQFNSIKERFISVDKIIRGIKKAIETNEKKIETFEKITSNEKQKKKFSEKIKIFVKAKENTVADSEKRAKEAQIEEETDTIKSESDEIFNDAKKIVNEIKNDLDNKKDDIAEAQKAAKENKDSEKKEGEDIVSKLLNDLNGEENGQSILLQILSSINIGSVLTFAGAAIAGMIVLNLKSDTIEALDKEIEKQQMEEEAEKAKKEIDEAADKHKNNIESAIDEEKENADAKIKVVENSTSKMIDEMKELKNNNSDILNWNKDKNDENDNEDANEEKEAEEEQNRVKEESDKQNREMDSKGSQFGDKFKEGTENADKQMFGDRASASTNPTSQPSKVESSPAEIDGNKVVIKDVEKLILPNVVSNRIAETSLSSERKPIGGVKQTINTKNKVKLTTNEEERKEITKAFEYMVKSNPELKYNIVKNVDNNTIKLVAEMDKNTNKRIDELAELLNDKIDGLAVGVSNIQNDVDITDIKNTINKLTNVCNTILQKLGA